MKEILDYKYCGEDGFWEVKVNRADITESVKTHFKEVSLAKPIVFNECKALSYDRHIGSTKSLRHKYHGQTYIIYPFNIKENEKDTYTITMTNDCKNCNGSFVVSKRELKERYPQLIRASVIEVKKTADKAVEDFVNGYSSLLSGGYNEVSITYNNNEYGFNVVASNSDDLTNQILSYVYTNDDKFDDMLKEQMTANYNNDDLECSKGISLKW